MIITRTPLRITLGGGGTDLPSYYERHGGFVISAAIDKYVYIGINRTFTDDYFIKYSALERVARIADVAHPIVREALRLHDVAPGVELVSLADIPAGTGLGSSGTFTVGLLRALYAYERSHATAGALAEEACHVEIDLLGQPVGKQDQYIAAFGGLTCFEFRHSGKVQVSPLTLSNDTLYDLEEHLVMFFTGYSRQASKVLEDQKTRSEAGDAAMIDNLHTVKKLGLATKEALEAGDTARFAALMHEHWLHKRERSAGMSSGEINRWYDVGMANGALGGKLVGAGAGGFLLFYTRERPRLRAAMAAEGLTELRFTFDHDGSTVMARGA
ncbi:MAG TPA: galactokinase [Acidimicrobiales bacterium]|nr:galactokinase [Acidimicrobiales bacterium]